MCAGLPAGQSFFQERPPALPVRACWPCGSDKALAHSWPTGTAAVEFCRHARPRHLAAGSLWVPVSVVHGRLRTRTPRAWFRFLHCGVGGTAGRTPTGSEGSVKLSGHLPSGLWPPGNRATRDSAWRPQGLVSFPRLRAELCEPGASPSAGGQSLRSGFQLGCAPSRCSSWGPSHVSSSCAPLPRGCVRPVSASVVT